MTWRPDIRLFLSAFLIEASIYGVSFLIGIFIVRTLSRPEYAIFTLTSAALGVMTVIADGGVQIGVMGQAGAKWKDRPFVSRVIATGFYLRKIFAASVIVVVLPFLVQALLKHGSTPLSAAGLIFCLIPLFWLTVTTSLFEVPLKLNEKFSSIQLAQAQTALLRLLLTPVCMWVMPMAGAALVASALGQLYMRLNIKRAAAEFIDLDAVRSSDVQKELIKVVRRTLPGAMYFAVSGQITIFLLSTFGTTSALADIGALGRLAIIMNIAGAVFSMIVTPRFSRLNSENMSAISFFLRTQICLTVLGAIFVFLTWAGAPYILALLGPEYSHLSHEVVLMGFACALLLPAGAAHGLPACRGILISPLISIPSFILVQILTALALDVTNVRQAIVFQCINSAFYLILHSAYFFWVSHRKPT